MADLGSGQLSQIAIGLIPLESPAIDGIPWGGAGLRSFGSLISADRGGRRLCLRVCGAVQLQSPT
jgi:hypothetical protein